MDLAAHRAVRVGERDLRDRFTAAERIVHVIGDDRRAAQPPADQVEHVRADVEQHAFATTPQAKGKTGRRGPIVLGAVVIADEPHGADRPLLQQIPHHLGRREEPADVIDREAHARPLARCHQLRGLGGRGRERFFAQHVHAGAQAVERDGKVQMMRQRNHRPLDRGQHVPVVHSGCRNAKLARERARPADVLVDEHGALPHRVAQGQSGHVCAAGDRTTPNHRDRGGGRREGRKARERLCRGQRFTWGAGEQDVDQLGRHR